MILAETLVSLVIRGTATTGYRVSTTIEGRLAAPEREVTPEAFQRTRAIVDALRRHLKVPGAGPLVQEAATAAGTELFHLWMAPEWAILQQAITPQRPGLLSLAVSDTALRLAPWELLQPPEGPPLGMRSDWVVRRLSAGESATVRCCPALPGPPLRVLLSASQPLDRPFGPGPPPLPRLIRTFAGAAGQLTFETASATLPALKAAIQRFQPQWVHLHGEALTSGGTGYFTLESDLGQSEVLSAKELVRELFQGSGVQCVIITGRTQGKAPPLAGSWMLAETLTAEGVPLAMGWPDDPLFPGTEAGLKTFYAALARGSSVDAALIQARRAAQPLGTEAGYPGWSLPVLYSSLNQKWVFNMSTNAATSRPDSSETALDSPPGMPAGLCRPYQPRTEALDRILPGLLSGRARGAWILGAAGVGKSVLATEIVKRLAEEERRTLAVSAAPGAPLSAARVVEAMAQDLASEEAIQAWGEETREAAAMLLNPNIPMDDRLGFFAMLLNRFPFALVLDGLENGLDPESGRFQDPEMGAFLRYLAPHLRGPSVVLLLSRQLPTGFDAVAADVFLYHTLEALPEAAFQNALFQERYLQDRYVQGDLSADQIEQLYIGFKRTPWPLAGVRAAINALSSEDLTTRLARYAPADSEPNGGWGGAFFGEILWDGLDEKTRQSACHNAACPLPLSVEQWATLAGCSTEEAEKHIETLAEVGFLDGIPLRGPDAPLFWRFEPLVARWLFESGRLADDEARSTQHRTADLVAELAREWKPGQLPCWSWSGLLALARGLYLSAGENTQALAVSATVSRFLHAHGFSRALESFNRLLLEKTEHAAPMIWVGQALLLRKEHSAARAWFDRAIRATDGQSPAEEAEAWRALGDLTKDRDAAIDAFNKALLLDQGIQNGSGEAESLLRLAEWDIADTTEKNQAPLGLGREKLKRAVENFRTAENAPRLAEALHRLAVLEAKDFNIGAAMRAWDESLMINQTLGNQAARLVIFGLRGNMLLAEGDWDHARENLNTALELSQRLGDYAEEARLLHQLATVDLNEGTNDSALKRLLASLALKWELKDFKGQAASYFQLGRLAKELNKPLDALRFVAICYRLDNELDHDDAHKDLKTCRDIANALGLSPEGLDELIEEAWDVYRQDQGQAWIKSAFAKTRKTIPITPVQ